jgi:hypothetical protein
MERQRITAHRWFVICSFLVAACTEEPAAKAPGEPFQVERPQKPEAPDPYVRSPSRHGVVPLHAGFSPDPRVVSGTALGELPARSIHRRCKGWISAAPDYLLDTDTAFFQLHVLARSRSDVTLVVRKPDGSVVCNDDRKGTTDPMIRSDFPIGTTQIWVGVKTEGATATYSLGLSEVKWHSASLPLPED